jgi:hypothetical protein
MRTIVLAIVLTLALTALSYELLSKERAQCMLRCMTEIPRAECQSLFQTPIDSREVARRLWNKRLNNVLADLIKNKAVSVVSVSNI